jgi:hypothetical protein
MNAAEILDRVFDIYKKSFGRQLAYAAIVGVIAFISLTFLIFGSVFIGVILSVTGNSIETGFNFPSEIILVAFMWLFILLWYLLWQAAASAGAILLSREAFLGRKVRLPKQRLLGTVFRAGGALIAQVIVTLPYLAAVGGLLFLFFRFTGYLDFFWMTRGFYVFSALLILGAVAGLIIYTHLFSLAIAIAVNERVFFFGAVRRSLALVKDNFWWLLGIRMIWLAVIFILYASAQGAFALLPVVSGWLAAGSPAAVPTLLGTQLITGIASVVIAFALAPLDGILMAVMYFNQRIKKEGRDVIHAL